VEFTNPTTGLTVTSNAEVGGELSVSGGATVSGNVGVGTTEPTETLDIVGNLNLQKVSNTASIKLNSNVVTEYTRSKKLIKYPRVAMTAATTAGYTVSASSIYSSGNYPPYEAFNNIFPPGDDSALEGWISSGSRYSTTATNGEYLADGTDTFSGAPSGEQDGSWIKLQLPIKIKLSHLVLKQRLGGQGQEYSKNVVVYASVDNSSWHSLGTFDPSGSETFTFYTNTSHYYDYFVLHVKSVNHSYGYTAIEELEYYGVPEYDPDAHGTDVIARSVPNVPNTDWLEVYYDGQDYTSMPATIDNKTGVSTYDATPVNGVGFDTEYKAFTFDGVDDYVSGNIPSSLSGNHPYSFSMWIKPDAIQSAYIAVFEMGLRTTNRSCGLYLRDGKIVHLAYANNLESTTLVIADQWIHITGTYTSGSRKVYANGQLLTSDTYSSLDIGATTLTLGANNDYDQEFDGSIANFRLFDRALTSDEIWQLYAYQKEYFGHGNLDMTLKGGRLGIGTFEPRAVLDVRGSIHANGGQSWPIPIAIFSNVTPSNTGGTYYERNIGTQWVYYNTVSKADSSGTILLPALNSRDITLTRTGLYEIYTASSLALQDNAVSSHIGLRIQTLSGNPTIYAGNGYEILYTDWNAPKLAQKITKVLVTTAPVTVGYYNQPISNYTTRFMELAYGNSNPIHVVMIKYLG